MLQREVVLDIQEYLLSCTIWRQQQFYCGYLYLSLHKIRKWLPRTNTSSQIGDDSYSAEWGGSRLPPPTSLTYAASCKIASERTTREINDFLDKGSGKAESISPEAKRESEREMERWRRRRRGYITLCSAPYHLHGLYSPRPPPCKWLIK